MIDANLRQRVDAVFADMDKSDSPGGALLVIDRDQVVYRRGYGLADLETGEPITSDSSFYLASLSKQFTAMAIVLLAERNQLGYDDPLPKHFPQFPLWGRGITIRHLLHHTSGLPDYINLFTANIPDENIRESTDALEGV